MKNYKLFNGDCLDVLKAFEDNSIDSVVTDPPYGLSAQPDIAEVMKHWIAGTKYDHKSSGFMGKSWDSFVPNPDIWKEVYRVMKPGAHALVFAGSRTQDLMSISLRFAGFEIRDCVMWLYGTGFPKSLNIAKAIQKSQKVPLHDTGIVSDAARENADVENLYDAGIRGKVFTLKEVTTDEAKLWNGYGTALKPAYEPILICMKPLDKNFVNNALKHGVAGLNINGSRIQGEVKSAKRKASSEFGQNSNWNDHENKDTEYDGTKGRFPANIILDEEAGAMLDEQTGELKSGAILPHHKSNANMGQIGTFKIRDRSGENNIQASTGGASRFFYSAKTSTSERNLGCENMKEQQVNDGRETSIDNAFQRGDTLRKNIHPTVKPISLMKYLCNLVKTPTGGKVLDPFMGSGSTGMACAETGQDFIGIELSPEYFEIAKARIEHAHKEKKEATPSVENMFNE